MPLKLRYCMISLVSGFSLFVTHASLVKAQADLAAGFPEIISTDTEIVKAILVLTFGLLILILQAISLKQAKASADIVMLSFVVNVIVISTLYVLAIGYDNQQVAPVFSLYGAIIGYLLGKEVGKRQLKEGGKDDVN